MTTPTTNATNSPRPDPERSTHLPGTFRLGLSRGIVEIRSFVREWESMIFTFSMPALILLFFAVIFDDMFDINMSAVDYYLPGLIAMGLMSVSFQTLGVAVATERDQGGLRRLRGTPLPPASYFIGKTVLVLFLAVGQVALLLGVAVLFFDATLPAGAESWATVGWVFVLGTVACALLGLAASSLARTAQAASAVIIVPFLLLQFTSGIFVPVPALPEWVFNGAALFPLLWMAQGLRAGFFPDEMASMEVSGSWDLPLVALVLGTWCVVGLVVTLATFRWKTRKDG